MSAEDDAHSAMGGQGAFFLKEIVSDPLKKGLKRLGGRKVCYVRNLFDDELLGTTWCGLKFGTASKYDFVGIEKIE